ncbi:hypothetical protein AO371_1125 [Moraxella catarrhalis]|uniref:hypothetical protein n=1 Tax=Moraxella catarrhalis TaxID=480 RepID=UPI0007F55A26|nr:hypothetical protein AO371_1125 [Moraxella catarrhalis]
MGLNAEISTEIAQAFDTDLADAVKDFTAVRVSLSDDDWAINDTPQYYLPSITAVEAFLQAFTPMRLIIRPSCNKILS